MMKLLAISVVLALLTPTNAIHHMKREIELRQNGGTTVPLVVSNMCPQTIYPGIVTQGGTGPGSQGFELTQGSSKNQTVSSDWQGRVWGRTNCSFNAQGQAQNGGTACQTGDCGGGVVCQATGQVPTTLAEFTLNGGDDQTYYDISIVDGYNLPLAIVMLGQGSIPADQANPSCVGSVGNLAPQNYNPYSNGQQFLGTSSSDPLPFDSSVTSDSVSQWCPWDLQVSPPSAPGNGVYPYPDSNIQRPAFDPCYSACAKYNKDSYCCTGSYDGPSKCSTNYYSKAAKTVCPDAYSYAYDDQTSTFITKSGPGFEVIFCPGGRSTTIISTRSGASSGSSKRSGGSFGSAVGRTYPIFDMFVGTSGWAVFSGLLTAIMAAIV